MAAEAPKTLEAAGAKVWTSSSRRAHPQIAEIASALLGEFASRYPVFFGDLLGPAE